jgi:hypothetical protein
MLYAGSTVAGHPDALTINAAVQLATADGVPA